MPYESQTTLLRLAAFVVDALMQALTLVLPATFISYAAARLGGSTKAVSLVWWCALLILLIGMLLRDGWRGRSPGKRVMGLRINTPDGNRCSWRRSLARNVTLLLLPIEVVLVLLGRDRLGDRIAKTSVAEE